MTMGRAVEGRLVGAAVTTDKNRQKKRGVTEVTCPKCGSRSVISRIPQPAAGADGNEGYFVQCQKCGTWLTGTIDPNDEAFLPL